MGLGHSPSIVRDGLVLYLDAANPKSYPGSGTTVFDLSSNQNNGTLVNGVGYSGSNLGSFSFDGVNDYIGFANVFEFNDNDFWSGLIWFKNDDNTRFFDQYRWHLQSSSIRTRGSNNLTILTNIPTQPHDNLWYNVYFTYEGATTRVLKLYVNGIFVGQSSTTGSPLSSYGNQTLSIGRTQHSGGEYSNNSVAIAGLYNRALTPQEIKQNFEALRGRFGI